MMLRRVTCNHESVLVRPHRIQAAAYRVSAAVSCFFPINMQQLFSKSIETSDRRKL